MNLFKVAKENELACKFKRCYYCNKEFKPDKRNLNRGWGMFCSKRCAVVYRNSLKGLNILEKKTEKRNYNLRKLGLD